MASFQVQKLLNSKFNKWNTSTSNNIDQPYGWSDGTGFGSFGFNVTTTSGLSLIGSQITELFSHPCIIYNDAAHVYTLSVDVKYTNATATNANIWVREFDESNTSTANYNFTPALTADTVTNTLTIGGTGSGATLILNTSTTFIQITFDQTNTVDYTWECSNCELLGDAITLDRGCITPEVKTETLLQKSGVSSGGDISAASSYGVALRRFELDLERMLKVDYDRVYGFLINSDIGVNQFPFNFTDEDGATWFGKITDSRIALGADGYQSVYLSLIFSEVPY